ncbi:hypothetical protein FGG08_006626 [Glutinoglossum americanum]|uniref:U3 small nucleolar RNA-associated protein 11 n=1 Tax=Glutinoglossum americanum TaxID=1670608 RepID=A0A9P8KUS4_9PEZI|nr:hypothetical protein FGG08_006626 [Glutinoglossum americanum]
MSSMRNALQRRNHRERAQPLERQKWGILEKHKDYSLRARDYNAKQARLKILREKAAERNPDEFYFGMMRNKTNRGGQFVADRGNVALSQDAVRLLKTQDIGYLRTMAQIEKRKKRKLQVAFAMGEASGNSPGELLGKGDGIDGKRIVFVESEEEQRASDTREYFGVGAAVPGIQKLHAEAGPEDERTQVGKPTGSRQSRRATERELRAVMEERARRKETLCAQEARGKMLEAVKMREHELIAAERELELQRARMGKTANAGGTSKGGIKWKCRERKR